MAKAVRAFLVTVLENFSGFFNAFLKALDHLEKHLFKWSKVPEGWRAPGRFAFARVVFQKFCKKG